MSASDNFDEFKARWRWLGWQLLIWSPIPLVAVAIFAQREEAIGAAAFLAGVAGAIKVYDLGFHWKVLGVATGLAAIAAIIAFAPTFIAVARHASLKWTASYSLGMLLIPLIVTTYGKTKNLLGISVVVALIAIAVSLWQFNENHTDLIEKVSIADLIEQASSSNQTSNSPPLIKKLKYKFRGYHRHEHDLALAIRNKYYPSAPTGDFMKLVGLELFIYRDMSGQPSKYWALDSRHAKDGIEARDFYKNNSWELAAFEVSSPDGKSITVIAPNIEEGGSIGKQWLKSNGVLVNSNIINKK